MNKKYPGFTISLMCELSYLNRKFRKNAKDENKRSADKERKKGEGDEKGKERKTEKKKKTGAETKIKRELPAVILL